MNWAVIMAGGVGERFWPLSRRKQPKQLQAIVTRHTMIQEAVNRLLPLVPLSRIVVVTNREQAPAVCHQLPRLKHLLAEPVGRNTAPCIAWAVQYIARRDPAAVLAVVPSDSHIADVAAYRKVVAESFELAARENVLVTVGIQPTRPATGYGYVQLGKPLAKGFWRAKRFVEKPELARARKFVASGQYRWNAGMFVWSGAAIAAAYQQHAPAVWEGVKGSYSKVEKISVDYAILEKADNVVVASGSFDWDDVGDWAAIERHFPRDKQGNVVARGQFIGVETNNCIVMGDAPHVVGAIGVSDLIIVHTPDATLVCHKQDAQRVRELVRQLDKKHT